VAERVCAEVPHRQFVFTIPQRLRIYFRFERSLLGGLCQGARRTVATVHQAVSGRTDAVPGMVGREARLGVFAPARKAARLLRLPEAIPRRA